MYLINIIDVKNEKKKIYNNPFLQICYRLIFEKCFSKRIAFY